MSYIFNTFSPLLAYQFYNEIENIENMKILRRQWSISLAILLFLQDEIQASRLQQQSALHLHQTAKSSLDLESALNSQTESQAANQAAEAQNSQYKSDALDELLEDSLFKKKRQLEAPSEDTVLDQAMKATVDLRQFNIDNQGGAAQQPSAQNLLQVASSQLATVTGTVPSDSPNEAGKRDMQLIQSKLKQYASDTQPEMGSSILYGAINDLDLSEANIPAYTPPGMPDKGSQNQLYGTELAPASAWAAGVQQGAQQSSELSQLPAGSLNDQSATQLSAESYMRGGNKYEEQAEQLMQTQDEELKNNVLIQQAVAQQKKEKEAEDQDTEEIIASAFTSIKTTSKQAQNIEKNIQLQDDLAYAVAFGT